MFSVASDYLQMLISNRKPEWCTAQNISEVNIQVLILFEYFLHSWYIPKLCCVDKVFFNQRQLKSTKSLGVLFHQYKLQFFYTKGQILDWSNFKGFAGDSCSNGEIHLIQDKNIVGKGENALYQHIVLFP